MSSAINEISANNAISKGKNNNELNGANKLKKKDKKDSSDEAADALKSQLASQGLFTGTLGATAALLSPEQVTSKTSLAGETDSGLSWMWRFMTQLFEWLGLSLYPPPPETSTPEFDPDQYAKDYVAKNSEQNVMGDLVLAFGNDNKNLKDLSNELLKGKDLKKAIKQIKNGHGEEVMMKLIKEFGAEKIVAQLATKLGKDGFESAITQFFS